MLIVLIIMALFAAIAAPKIDYSKTRAKAAAQRLGTTLLAMQREAISRQHNIVVVIDTAHLRIRIIDDSTNDGTWNNNERVRSVEIGEGIRFGRPAGVTARPFGGNPVNFTTIEPTTGLPAIVFYRNGSADEYGGVYISSAKAMTGTTKSGIWALELTRATGRAEWYNWNGAAWKRGF
jgi:type II secretory pathway pseudopilin PulG